MSEQTCPVWGLPDFVREHWDFDTLCGDFDCKVCVAAPEDFGWGGEPPEESKEEGLGEIPF